MKIVFGGSFDPIHNGHIAIIKYLYENFHTKVILLPNNGDLEYKAPHFFTAADRKNMLNIILDKYSECCELSNIELECAKYTPTTYSIAKLHEIYPGEMLYFVVGYDSLINLETWDNWQELSQNTNFIVFSRNSSDLICNYALQLPESLQDNLNIVSLQEITEINNINRYGQVVFAKMGNVDVSSTIVRNLIISKQAGWEKMVDSDIAAYINSIKR